MLYYTTTQHKRAWRRSYNTTQKEVRTGENDDFVFFCFMRCYIMVIVVELAGVVCFCFAVQNISNTFFCFLYVFCFFLFFCLCFFYYFFIVFDVFLCIFLIFVLPVLDWCFWCFLVVFWYYFLIWTWFIPFFDYNGVTIKRAKTFAMWCVPYDKGRIESKRYKPNVITTKANDRLNDCNTKQKRAGVYCLRCGRFFNI